MASVLVLALTACGSDTESAVERVVDDSAGVRIVTLAATPDMEAPFAFGPEPLYRHGAGAGDYMFSSVRRGILLGDGSAAIFDSRNSELVLLNPDGTFRSVLAPAGEGPGEATYDYVPFRPPEGTPENPFPHFGIAGAVGGEFLYGRTDTPELIWRRPDGSVRQIVRWEPDPVYPTEEDWDIFAAELRETAPRHNPHAQTEEAIEELVTSMLGRYELEPDVPLPLFTTPRGDDEGRIWLGEFVAGYGGAITTSYRILSAEGEWLGRVDLPEGLRILDIAGGRVLGVMKDEMEVESAVVFELAEVG